MKSRRIFLIVALTIFATIVVFFVISKSGSKLVSPIAKQSTIYSFKASPTPLVQPSTPSYNPPKEIKYDSSTDLQKELDSVDPKVLDSDFGK